MQLENLPLSHLIYPALPKPDLLCYFNKTIAPCPSFSMLCVCDTWHILMRPSARSNQTASCFLETRPVCKTQTHSEWYSLPSSYPFLFCHLSTRPHCGNPSQVRTKWVTQGGSQLEQAGPWIRFPLDSGPCLGLLTAPECISDVTSLMAWHARDVLRGALSHMQV